LAQSRHSSSLAAALHPSSRPEPLPYRRTRPEPHRHTRRRYTAHVRDGFRGVHGTAHRSVDGAGHRRGTHSSTGHTRRRYTTRTRRTGPGVLVEASLHAAQAALTPNRQVRVCACVVAGDCASRHCRHARVGPCLQCGRACSAQQAGLSPTATWSAWRAWRMEPDVSQTSATCQPDVSQPRTSAGRQPGCLCDAVGLLVACNEHGTWAAMMSTVLPAASAESTVTSPLASSSVTCPHIPRLTTVQRTRQHSISVSPLSSMRPHTAAAPRQLCTRLHRPVPAPARLCTGPGVATVPHAPVAARAAPSRYRRR
jgi:hypothetical protein